MSYIDNILEPGEKLLYRTNRHWIVFWRPAAVSFVGLILLISLESNQVSVGGTVISIGGLWLFWIYLYERLEEYAVTSRRVVFKEGILRRDVVFFPLDRVQTVDVRQSLIGRLLNYGAVVVHTAATTHGTTEREHISHPEEWRRQIFLAIESSASRSSVGPQGPSADEPTTPQNTADRLRDLERLFKEGLVSQDEYEQKRKELVEKL